jgi:sulfonate transport system ATP-binding protein
MEEKEIKGEEISIRHVKKDFQIEKDSLMVLKDINLEIEAGDIVSIIGGSGCGKSTLLRLIAGLDHPNAGTILIAGKEVQKPSVDVGVLFQESRLLPWENTEKNIAFGLPEKFPREKKKELVKKYIKLVGLDGFEKALPGQLSGGMQKRVAIARTLINRPHILLLDEPFGALDAFTRMNLQEEVVRIWREERMTTVLVTHDIDEAIFMGNKVIIMSAKPGVVKDVIKIDIPGKRSRTSYDFEQIRLRIYKEFFGEDKVPEDYSI